MADRDCHQVAPSDLVLMLRQGRSISAGVQMGLGFFLELICLIEILSIESQMDGLFFVVELIGYTR